jgi:hypothetical protein
MPLKRSKRYHLPAGLLQPLLRRRSLFLFAPDLLMTLLSSHQTLRWRTGRLCTAATI